MLDFAPKKKKKKKKKKKEQNFFLWQKWKNPLQEEWHGVFF